MSSLREKMNRLKGIKPADAEDQAAASPASADLPEKQPVQEPSASEAAAGGLASAGPEWDRHGVKLVANEAGDCLERRITLPLSHRSGHHFLSEWAGTAGQLGAFHPEAGEAPHAENVLFLDLETTGLGAGTGNVPFMMGLAYFEDGAFILRQFLIRHPAEERAMLQELLLLLPRFRWLGTYNGRSFDWPLVQSRFIMNGFRGTPELLHLDFLHPSRSIWKNTLVSCKLSHVEEERLGIFRTDDVPGSLAPALYFHYLAEGDPDVLEGVFRHNEQDMVTLACLGIRFGHLLAGAIGERMPMPEENEERLRTGLWLEKMGRTADAERLFAMVEASEEPAPSAWHSLAMRAKKTGNWDRAVVLWQKAAACMRTALIPNVDAHVELAMFYEHKRKDVHSALAYAEEAIGLFACRPHAYRSAKERAGQEALLKRRDRLRRKCGGGGAMLEVDR
ncbi:MULTISPECIES: ribonuclease H-like domain-containing protein [unclassified Paenibacillus]|uniref:ribonuclease H-like domain-containing protein n=1 Tax=unclassified Paenibacillus TaxID=185978 RepID=UPI00040C0F4A|nr:MULTISPECIES: ribonuclease H-like domain-containing protein [unclassified Paenibacillus]KKC46393.1 hypothetical protein VE23_03545 [Paenibacillus sp. D9]CDN43123.1 Uncharacterized protein YprB [Paenibacillus sp. P22]